MLLSAYIIAHNEEKKIGNCIDSCKEVADEIIVVHNNCTDRTVEIAKSKGALCYEHPWTNYRDQKSFALSMCKNEWTLNLDADEILSDQLIDSINKILEKEHIQFSGFSFNRRSFFLNRWINHGDWYPDRITRMSRIGKSKWAGPPLHEFLEVDGTTSYLKGDILHYSYESINQLVEKTLRYTDLNLHSSNSKSDSPLLFSIIFRCFWRFFRSYFIRLGFLDGKPGFIISVNSAFYVFLKYIKLDFSKNKT